MSGKHANGTELRILGFLWQWKLATTAALSLKFFPEIGAHSAYKRIKSLERRGLIGIVTEPTGTMFFWTLTKRGFQALRPHLPALDQEGFKSENLQHDHLVICFHLGDWLCGIPEGALLFTEQQLRRYSPCNYPEWVPYDSAHRPDGYWSVKSRTIAVEIELSLKTERDYYAIGKFYDWQKKIDHAYWLLPSPAAAKRIRKYFERAQLERLEMHSFVIKPQFQKFGWGAPLHFGADHGKRVDNRLGRFVGGSWEVPPTELLLDCRKWSTKFMDYRSSVTSRKPLLTPMSSPHGGSPQITPTRSNPQDSSCVPLQQTFKVQGRT